ncbi:MAG TPA: hypothetical protein VMM93_02300 [Vicinamibacterales bacterium]|nr:hypothetical protein [Vicinamibacterales bacterium]
MSRAILVASLAVASIAPAVAARAQPAPREPISPYVVDVRGAIPFLKQSVETAGSLFVSPADLPGRGWGLVAGAHVYPIRVRGFALGVGGEWFISRARRELVDATGEPTGGAIARQLDSLSAQLSLNFGHRDGWSYLSGGAGPLTFDTYDDASTPDSVRAMTLNYGGGARWFTRPHLAAGFDVRFYITRPSTATAVVGARGQQTVLVISVGISVR